MALDRLTKIDGGGISTTSDYRVGIITASKFVGPFDGTGGNFSGVITATDGNFSGNVTIGGTLTYEDVTNIDSVGIITARGSIYVADSIIHLGDTDTKIEFSTNDIRTTAANKLRIHHAANGLNYFNGNNISQATSTHTKLAGSDYVHRFRDEEGDDTLVQFFNTNVKNTVLEWNAFGNTTGAGNLIFRDLNTGNTEYARFTGTGSFNIAKDLDVDGHTNLDNVSIAGVTTVASDTSFIIGSNATSKYNIDFKQNSSTNRNSIDSFYMDFKIHDLQIRDESNNSLRAYFWPGEVALYSAGGKKFSTIGSGIKVHTVGDGHGIILDNTTYRNNITAESNRPGANNSILELDGKWNNTQVAFMTLSTGDDTTNKDDGRIRFFTKPSGGSIAERLRIEPDGQVVFGGAGSRDVGFTHRLQIEDTNDTPHGFSMTSNRANQYGPHMSFAKSRGSTRGSSTIVQDDDELATLLFRGADGTDITTTAAQIDVRVDGTPGSNNIPGSFEFYTRNASSQLDKRLIINSAGHLMPGADSTYNIGSSSVRFANVYADTLYGDGSNLTGITQTTINNNTNNYVVTATGTANTLQGEANLIYNGTGLGIGESSPANLLHVKVSDAGVAPHSSAQIVLERDGTNYLQFLTTTAATSGILFGDTNDIDVGKLVYDHHLADMQFVTEGSLRMALTGTGDLKLPDDGAIELGGSLTSGNGDLRIYHAASDNNSYIVEGGSGSLMIQGDIINIGNVGSSKYYIRAFEDGAVQLRYGNNLTKLATTETGIEVTGEVAATQDYPLVKPILNWNFAATKTLDPRIRFRRNGTGTYIDEKGIVQYAGNNKPRFDHHPTSGASLGLLLEKSSTNYQEYSTLMSEANHKNNILVTNNFAISPDGTQNASKIVNASSSNAQTNIGWNANSVANGSYANWSIFVKSEETSCILQFYSNTYIFGHDRVNIELADGTYGGDAIDSTFRWIIEKYPNKWWRISVSGNGQGAAGGWYVGVVDSKSAARGATCGSATNKTWFAWGVQEEISTDRKFATSYIPTYGVSMNRGHDNAEVLGDDFDDFFDRYQGTVIHEFSNAFQYWTGGGSGWEFNNDNYQYNCITQISSGYSHNGYPGAYAVAHGESSDSGSNSMSLFGSNSSPGNSAHQNGYYAGRFPNNSTPDSARFYKTYTDGMSWDVSGPTNYIRTGSGGFSTTGSNTNVISYRNISKLVFGNEANDMDGSYQKFNGRIKNWMYYDKALSASQLATMTAQHPVTYL